MTSYVHILELTTPELLAVVSTGIFSKMRENSIVAGIQRVNNVAESKMKATDHVAPSCSRSHSHLQVNI